MRTTSRAFVFDLGNVVCDFVPERRLAGLAQATGRPLEEISARLWGSDFSDDCDTGRLGAAAIEQRVMAEVGFEGGYDALMRIWASAFQPNPSILELIDGLRGHAVTALLTDNPEILSDALPIVFPEVADRFDRLFFSYQIGVCKPALAAFAHVTRELELEPAGITFIDDAVANVEAAGRYGWEVIRFVSVADLAVRLKEFVR